VSIQLITVPPVQETESEIIVNVLKILLMKVLLSVHHAQMLVHNVLWTDLALLVPLTETQSLNAHVFLTTMKPPSTIN
jgi:hypothetical protein